MLWNKNKDERCTDRCILYCILFVFMLALLCFCVATEFSMNTDLYKRNVSENSIPANGG